jgi:CheY-like chemotaxis protein
MANLKTATIEPPQRSVPSFVTQAKVQPSILLNGSDRPITILLVDDDADCRMLIRDAIAECKVSNEVFEVSSGEEALEFLAQRGQYANAPRPGLIYLDIEMPGINGLETLRRIKAQHVLQDIPVVMMTGVCGEAEMKRAAEYGANSYTLKPANAEQFLRTVLASTSYWLTIHQYPEHHIPPEMCRR